MNEYWQKPDTDSQYDSLSNPFILVDKTNTIRDAKDANADFTIIGGKYKYNIDLSVFEGINEALEKNIDKILESNKYRMKDKSQVLNFAFNCVGQLAHIIHNEVIDGIMVDDNI